ncbi:hypothetical protein O6P43_029208 [Quillaja saponaria]|uniref:Uncharacterized protein n=1 Tax=Quillaja saponaria TaxID=32244 RepID=A0AAD7KZH4_QUISA|nr:hypothetical protein O6P43_029208 [Quillaja saponaria]
MALMRCFTPRTSVPLPNLKFFRQKIVTVSVTFPFNFPHKFSLISCMIVTCAQPERPPISDGKGGKIHGTSNSRNLGEEKVVKSNPAKKNEDKGSKEAEINGTTTNK